MWKCNWLDLKTLRAQPLMPQNLPDQLWCTAAAASASRQAGRPLANAGSRQQPPEAAAAKQSRQRREASHLPLLHFKFFLIFGKKYAPFEDHKCLYTSHFTNSRLWATKWYKIPWEIQKFLTTIQNDVHTSQAHIFPPCFTANPQYLSSSNPKSRNYLSSHSFLSVGA